MVTIKSQQNLDWHSGNIFRDEGGILTFVDTEEGSFARFSTKKQLLANQQHYFKSLELGKGITREWLNDLLESEGESNRPCGWHQKKYDDPDIDFAQAKKEFKPWQEEMAKKKSQQ